MKNDSTNWCRLLWFGLAWGTLLADVRVVQAQTSTPPYVAPDDLNYRQANIMSEGTRLSAEVFSPKVSEGARLPTILMAHGWGGTAAGLRSDAVLFARAGYLVMTFDYRGWGRSDGRLLLAHRQGETQSDGTFVAEVREVREVVDPLDFAADWLNAIHWAAGEPRCDAQRIGLWGSSFSGGLVVYVAARDHRVRAIHSQVPSLDGRFVIRNEAERKKTYDEATQRARGEIGYPDPGAHVIGKLRGAPIRSRFAMYAPVDDVAQAQDCAMQFVVADKEELFDNRDHGILAYERAHGPKNLVSIPGITHYGIYGEARQRAQQLAIAWFDKHLKDK